MAIYRCNKSIKEINHRKELSPINILTIDFDWIMEPSIEAYNNLVQFDDTRQWHNMESLIPGASFECSYDKYHDLCALLADKGINIQPNNYKIIDSHHQIINLIPENIPFNLINIDHHHDCGYKNTIEAIEQDELNCGNWVYKLAHDSKYKMKSYLWIGNHNSNTPSNELINKIPNYSFTRDIQTIDRININNVYLCFSPGYIPNKYYPMFWGLVNLFENLVNK